MTRPDWTPISADPSPSSRDRRLEVTERTARTLTAGAIPCPKCGGADPISGCPDVCQCGTDDGQLTQRLVEHCERMAASAPTVDEWHRRGRKGAA